ncbi:MAG: 4-(cytidine 5'-diphospho)-2-C-methyl-D-erythritol kinase [Magnetococcales bacterium]|nr:4-(cytidine 5'-diphospho)-2-C-methyl-D-erythritol kinase [Magnetococcales bacterium]
MNRDGATLRIAAPAKVNLGLRVVGRRADGYHLLRSVMTLLDWGDELHIEPLPTPELHLTCEPEVTLRVEENLVWRAAERLRHRCAISRGARIHLIKRTPTAAGLGGGSSDAASTLLALNHLWQCGLSLNELREVGLALGADVPFFVAGESALAQGIGEILRPVSLDHPLHLVLANPGKPLATALVFKTYGAQLTSRHHPANIPGLDQSEEVALLDWRNDLEATARSLLPEMDEVFRCLADCQPAQVRMSGSGPTVYGVFARSDLAQAAAEVLKGRHPAWWVRQTDTLSRHPFHLQHGLPRLSEI